MSDPIPIETTAARSASGLSRAQPEQCPACRNYVEDDGDFCEHCGAKVSAAPAEDAQAAQESAARERAERARAERERIERERVAREKAEEEKLTRERTEHIREINGRADQRQVVAEKTAERRAPAQDPPLAARNKDKGQSVSASAANVFRAARHRPLSFVAGGEPASESAAGSQRAFATGRLAVVIASAFALSVVGVLALVLFTARRKEQMSPAASGSPAAVGEPAKASAPAAPDGMVYVPGGAFMLGRDDGVTDERPAHEVNLRPFFIDRYEVTREQYRDFVGATGHRAPKNWLNGMYPRGTVHWPVTGVTWSDATAYASWAGKRLPTEEEWELAARGADGRLYPWGNQWRRADDVAAGANASDTSAGHLIDVGASKGASPFGAYDMVGNAWEWTAGNWAAYPGGSLAKAPAYPDMKVMRGNFWGADSRHATTTFRIGWPADSADRNVSYENAGFRCAKDAPPSRSGR